ncbi:hypothetical protein K501DRAFT_261898 [Backusella circina FSU 941]|nr:hypothetical protein K501DRAFT_261898 [Backusella circina FSU 941]
MFLKSVQRTTRSTTLMAKRFTAYQSGSEGATAASKGSFGEKERAIENQWARSHDADKLKLLREALATQEKATEAIRKDLDALEKKQK